MSSFLLHPTTTTGSTTQKNAITTNVITQGGWAVVPIQGMGTAGKIGNAVQATQNFPVGHVVFRERPVVSASWFDHHCTCCSSDSHAVQQCPLAPTLFSRSVIARLTDIEEELSNLYGIQELDKARTFILALQKASTQPHVLQQLLSLTTANLEMCMATVELIKSSSTMCTILPSTLSLVDCAKILSALNTNAHMLEEGGSALYPEAGAMFEHSCLPNCVFNTFGNELWVVVTKEVKAGERLSIDYINGFYEPKEIRQEMLLERYAFDCACSQCTSGLDKPRAFHCPQCTIGPVCPRSNVGNSSGTNGNNSNSNDQTQFVCVHCSWIMPQKNVDYCIQREEEFGDSNPPTTEAEIDSIVAQGVFHVTHHFLWVSMLHIGEEMAGNPMKCRDGSAIHMWSRVLAGARFVLPSIHPELVVLEDKMGQICVCAGKKEEASKAFQRAYAMSCILTGKKKESRKKAERKQNESRKKERNHIFCTVIMFTSDNNFFMFFIISFLFFIFLTIFDRERAIKRKCIIKKVGRANT